jgi:Fe-S oxidoreductase
MATYKAEFLSHYYEGRRRPLRSYAFGLINHWSALAEYVPWLANVFTQTRPFSTWIKAILGVAPERALPAFAPRSFRRGFVPTVEPAGQTKPRVLLWADTFNNYFNPDVSHAAVDVLQAAGFHVDVPRKHLCCGRPLYDHGMLTVAKRRLQEILDALGPDIDAGTPVVGLEPSCVAVFRDELLRFFPDDPTARRLSQQTFLLSEFLEQQHALPDLRLTGRALVHPHCHHRAVLRLDDEVAVLRRLGLDSTVLDSGCCGMAGAFGFERDHYDVSIQLGERVLLPAVRAAAADDYVVVNGFSCREQVQQTTGRRVWHLAQVLREAIRRR